MDLSNFSLLKEDEQSFHVKHPGGKTLVIDKSTVSPKAHELIKKFACGGMAYADGGEVAPQVNANGQTIVPDDDQDNPNQVTVDMSTPTPQVTQNGQTIAPDPVEISVGPDAPIPQNADDQSNVTIPQQSQQMAAPAQGGIQQEMAGQTALAKAEGVQGQQQGEAIDENADEQEAMPSQQDLINDNKAKDAQMQQAFAQGKIDPNHFINSLGTGGQIMAGLGMILSGFGAGASHQQNLAYQTIENAINRDIDAQKNEQGKNLTMWKMNREALGTDLQANLATKNQMYQALQSKLQGIAAKNAGTVAGARAQIANGELQRQIDQLHYQQSLLNPTQETAAGAAPNSEQAYTNHLNTLRKAEQMGLVKPEITKDLQDRLIPGVGVAQITPTPEDRTELTNYDAINKNINQALSFQQSGPGGGIGAWSPANRRQAAVIQGNLINTLDQLGDIKRMTPDTVSRYKTMIGNPGSLDAFGSNAAGLKQMQQEIQTRQKAVTNNLGVKPFVKAPQDLTAIAVAKQRLQSNPADPVALKALRQNGL